MTILLPPPEVTFPEELPVPAARRKGPPPLVLGAVFSVLLVAVVLFIFVSFAGGFSNYVVVQAQLPASSTAVALNAPVEYRNVSIGTVASEGRSVPGGLVVVTLHLDPSMIASVPAGVTATVTPVSFFGDPYVVLEPPAVPGAATLAAGATIPAEQVGQTASLQSTLGDLDSLLVGLHPAELDAALTALAGALQGQGASIGQNLDRANAYLQQMLPLWPTVVSDLQRLVPVSGQLAASTPNILAILANQTTTGSTVTSEAAAINEALGGGATLASETSQLLTAIQQPYAVLTADAAPFLQDLSQSPTEISQLLQGLDAWAKAWTAAESTGPYINLTTEVKVANPADLGLAVLGGPDVVKYLSAGLGPGYVNPPTYSSAGSLPAIVRDAAAAGPPVMAGPAETAAVSKIVESMTGSAPTSPSVSALLLSPVLAHVVQSR